jgi:hypothetical protein
LILRLLGFLFYLSSTRLKIINFLFFGLFIKNKNTMAKVVNIVFDTDPEKTCKIDDIGKVRDLDELMEIFKSKTKMPDLDENEYGF